MLTIIEAAIAHAATFTAEHLDIKAIAALTHSGTTALLMSRMNPEVPIYAMSPVVETRHKVTLFRGVHPIYFAHTTTDPEEVLGLAEDALHRTNKRRCFTGDAFESRRSAPASTRCNCTSLRSRTLAGISRQPKLLQDSILSVGLTLD